MTPGEELDANIERQRKRDQAAMQEGSRAQETKRLEERLAERDAACGPMCASSVLQTQWQKIQRLENLLGISRRIVGTFVDGGEEIRPELYDTATALIAEIDDEGDKP